MVIRRNDRVSTVLSADEGLIDVFVSLSPAFERLRSPAMRKVMSRLVTVEQAARMAGIDADVLVARLNGERESAAVAGANDASPGKAGLPARLAAMPGDAIVDVDVREDLRNGKEPFSRIMSARRDVPADGALRVRAIFEPVPLYAVMTKQGFAHHTEELGPEDWRVWFFSADDADEPEPMTQPIAEAGADTTDEGVVVLDVRGLEPPEPMVRTLEALETLPPGGTLVQINVRVPRFLLPMLDERGFTYEVREQAADLVRVFIRRARPA